MHNCAVVTRIQATCFVTSLTCKYLGNTYCRNIYCITVAFVQFERTVSYGFTNNVSCNYCIYIYICSHRSFRAHTHICTCKYYFLWSKRSPSHDHSRIKPTCLGSTLWLLWVPQLVELISWYYPFYKQWPVSCLRHLNWNIFVNANINTLQINLFIYLFIMCLYFMWDILSFFVCLLPTFLVRQQW